MPAKQRMAFITGPRGAGKSSLQLECCKPEYAIKIPFDKVAGGALQNLKGEYSEEELRTPEERLQSRKWRLWLEDEAKAIFLYNEINKYHKHNRSYVVEGSALCHRIIRDRIQQQLRVPDQNCKLFWLATTYEQTVENMKTRGNDGETKQLRQDYNCYQPEFDEFSRLMQNQVYIKTQTGQQIDEFIMSS